MDDNEGMTFTDMIIISGQRYIDEMEQRIAALEAELTEYKAVAANMSDIAEQALADRRKLLALVREVAQVAPVSGSSSSTKHAFWIMGEKARALLAELEGGEDG